MNYENLKKHAQTILKGLVLLLAIFAVVVIFKECSNSEKPNPTFYKDTDTITPKIEVNKSENDSLTVRLAILEKSLKTQRSKTSYYKSKYKSVYDSVYSASDSICRTFLSLVNSERERLETSHEAENQVNQYIIDNQFKQIENHRENERLFELQHVQDTSKISYLLNDSIPKVRKIALKEGKRIGRKQGVIGTVIVGSALFIGVKSVIP
jgi:hypothetical protein